MASTKGDFKSKVQQKIFEMQNDIKNPSPIRSPATTYGNLDSYIKKQNQPCFKVEQPHHINKDGAKSGSIDSMQVNFDNQSNPINVATARFISHHGGAAGIKGYGN